MGFTQKVFFWQDNTLPISFMPPTPSYTLHKCIKDASMSADGATCFMEYHQLVTIEDMLLFFLSKSKDLMNIYNGQKTLQTNKFGMAVHMKVTAYIY